MIHLVAPNGMFTVELHESLYIGLCNSGALPALQQTLEVPNAVALDLWANRCDNPVGQRADLARAIAALIRVAGSVVVSLPPVEGRRANWAFWEAASQ